MSKSIRVDGETYAALAAMRDEDETFDDLLSRLVQGRRDRVREGAGLWSGTDAAEKVRNSREEMKQGVGN